MVAGEMKKRGHTPIIFYNKSLGDNTPLYKVSDGIPTIALEFNNINALLRSRKKIITCDIDVFCGMFSSDTLLLIPQLLNNTGIPLLISEHNNPNIIESERWNMYERRACLMGADRIHVLTKSYYDMLPSFLQKRAKVIANPIWSEIHTKHFYENKRILAVGRFVDEMKQFSILIKAFSRLSNRFLDWNLYIYGDGECRSEYIKLIRNLKLQDRIFLPGMIDNIDSEYAKADIFCIPSRYEGFPLVLLEAQSHGIPCVGFEQCSGVNEIIIHGENGILSHEMTVESLAACLKPLLENKELRKKMGDRSKELCYRYNRHKIMDAWEALLVETAQMKGKTALQINLTEEEATKNALNEILCRKYPFNRPDCSSYEKVILKQRSHIRTLLDIIEDMKKK